MARVADHWREKGRHIEWRGGETDNGQEGQRRGLVGGGRYGVGVMNRHWSVIGLSLIAVSKIR